jgi:DNA topoisomerase-1
VASHVSALTDVLANREAAAAAGLQYVTAGEPGLSRARHGSGFVYRDMRGRIIRDARTLDRIRSLVIPPAWTDVWICARPDGHLQATGRDARGRKQHRYHRRWTEARQDFKYDRMIEFAQALPAIRRRVRADLRKPALSRDHVLATVVTLLEKTLIRIGNKEYARANKSFGLTTLQDEHVEVKGSSVKFRFRAKSGIMQTIQINDAPLARIIKRCRALPGKTLFQYIDPDGSRQCVDSAAVNAYLHEITGRPFTAKNFRTWAATVRAAFAVCHLPKCASDAAFKRNIVPAIDAVAARLGNTRAVCRSSYIHPAIFQAYRHGVTIAGSKVPSARFARSGQAPTGKANFSKQEAATLALLKRGMRHAERVAA